ncbi:hypothetical protein [Pseudobacteroides cellulosolvens]|uniref:hypothetical protein n=1 Tax=Pseudobacteroides cellulosolvens TaxID=35825 RepID=UPI00128F9615|nr:hypothetical protein [Pseudobacteroides cellulosolvens]
MDNKFKAISSNVGELGRDNLVSFLASSDSSNVHKIIEIFDIAKGEVIREIEANTIIQNKAELYLTNITGMYDKVKAIPEKGYIARVPFEPSAKVNNKWLNFDGINSMDQMFIIFPENGEAYLLVLDEKFRPLFYNFESDTSELMDLINTI